MSFGAAHFFLRLNYFYSMEIILSNLLEEIDWEVFAAWHSHVFPEILILKVTPKLIGTFF